MRTAAKSEHGFTLTELLIVIIILGILAAVVVFTVGNTRDDAVASSCETRVRSVVSSAEGVKTTTSAYPVGTIDATTPSNPLLAPEPGALLDTWPTGDDYVLRYEGTGGTSYEVQVFAADGVTAVAGCGDL